MKVSPMVVKFDFRTLADDKKADIQVNTIAGKPVESVTPIIVDVIKNIAGLSLLVIRTIGGATFESNYNQLRTEYVSNKPIFSKLRSGDISLKLGRIDKGTATMVTRVDLAHFLTLFGSEGIALAQTSTVSASEVVEVDFFTEQVKVKERLDLEEAEEVEDREEVPTEA